MSLIIIISIVTVSLLLSVFFILRDAKSFALAPPTPLIDLDRLYDYIFINLDEDTGKKVTPLELKRIIELFIKIFSENQLISEDLAQADNPVREEGFSPEYFTKAIKEHDPKLDVEISVINTVMSHILTYLSDIGALA